MYTTRQAALRAGVLVPVLRQWERRYGFIVPGRTASGYRTYDDADISRVRAMRALVHEGWAPVAVVIAVVVPTDVEPVDRVGAASEAVRPDVLVAFGGPAASGVLSGARRIMLPTGLIADVEALQAALQG